LVLSLLAGYAVNHHPVLGPFFTVRKETLAVALIVYGFLASVLPVWLLLAPRDYLVTFLKLGVVALLAIGIVSVLPSLKMPALTHPDGFPGGMRPVVAGNLFPFCFITIACGAISGFHSLVSSGTTPKMITRERHIRSIGYGAMCVESFVAIMAMIAACLLEPGLYFAVNAPAGLVGTTPEAVASAVTSWGFPIRAIDLTAMAEAIGEKSILARTGGAPTLAIGMARIFGHILGGEAAMKIWYHFALMFEALFILTTVDVATRIGRFLIQELAGRVWKPAGNTTYYPANIGASVLFAGAWGYFLFVSVRDPLGGVNSLWPLFGIANQLLACVALCLAATILIKAGRTRFSPIVLVPLAWLSTVTFTAGLEKVFHSNPRVGFLAMAQKLTVDIAEGNVPTAKLAATRSLIFNNQLDAVVALIFLSLIVAIMIVSVREWWMVLTKRKPAILHEEPAQFLLATVIESEHRRRFWGVGRFFFLFGSLAKELSGEAASERTHKPPLDAYADTLQQKYDNPKSPSRCC
jgi:carbon starvation protein